MKSLNAKRIAAIVTGAALLGAGLAFAGPLTFQNVPIISNSGQPVVQIVIGSQAKPSDGVAAGNIAAAIGNLAYTSVPVTGYVNPASENALTVSVSSAKYSLSNQQVWLNESGITSATGGTYLFSALIGSVLNQGIQLGTLQYTKANQGTGSYAFPESFYTTNSPIASPYTAVGSVPISTSVTVTNGGGVTFSTFTSASNDNLLQVTNTQFNQLKNNWGTNGETEYLFLTGFPVYNTQSGVNAFQLLDAGGAYEAIFNKPIANKTNSNTISIDTPISLLGQNYTILNATGTATGIGASNKYETAGQAFLASSISALQTVYVGHNLSSGPWTVQLQDLAQTNQGVNAAAAVAVYYNGVQSNESTIFPGNTVKFNVSNHLLFLNINASFAGLYAYQKWAKMQLYTNVFKVVNNQPFNSTNDKGWYTELLWTNTTSTSGKANQLYGIVLYNSSPVALSTGQSFTFIQQPATFKFTFIGDTLGNNFDQVTAQLSTVSGLNYADSVSGAGTSITNITEPAQLLTVSSQISSAFSYGGQSSSQILYDLTPYTMGTPVNTVGLTASTYATNVVFTYNDPSTANGGTTAWISTGQPLSVTIKGYSQATKTFTQQTATFVYNTTSGNTVTNTLALTTPLFNVTQISIQGNRALPIFPNSAGLSITVYTANSANAVQANAIGSLSSSATPTVLYTQTGQTYYSTTTSSASVNYNQQNGQPIANVILTPAATTPTTAAVPHRAFLFKVGEVSVPANSLALDYLGVGIYNNSPSASPTFVMNYSQTGSSKNVTYTSTQAQTINVQAGFRTEKGSKVAAISPSGDTFDMATAIDQLQFSLSSASGNSVVSKAYHTYGPYSVGQATNLPNVSIAAVNATPILSGTSTYTIQGINNLSVVTSVTSATTPVLLKNLSSTAPLVVLDSQANPGSNLILIGSGYVNSLSKELDSTGIDPTTSSSTPVAQASGTNRILVAGYTADQTMSEANSFINQLYTLAASSG